MSINKRIFGTPLEGIVRDKLEARQGETVNLQPGQSLEGRNVAVSNYDYASKLPFVRMWTSIKICELEEIERIPAEDLQTPIDDETFKNLRKKAIKDKKLDIELNKTRVKEIKSEDGILEHYAIVTTRDQQAFDRKIYEIGNHNYLKNYGEVKPNEAMTVTNQEGEQQTLSSATFANESEKNPLMKPQSGITSITSETEGSLGLIKKTIVNFVVHNFYDFDNIFSKYFLAPGAQIFVDFGFSDIPNLYRPQDLITFAEQDNGGLQKYLYDEKEGFITKNQGDVEVLQGIVTDYSATIQKDGSVNCSVTLTSKNSALLSFTTDDDIVMRVKSILTRGVLYLGLRAVVGKLDEDGNYEDDSDKDLEQLMSTPNADTPSDTIETYNKNLLILAKQELSGESGPEGNSIRTGVFVENLNADNTFITWGLFEDLIINSQFGFGKDNNDIVNGKNLQVKMNSSNSFTRWDQQNKEKQHILFQVPEDVPTFTFPEWWGGDEPGNQESGGSYSYQKGKLPEIIERDKKGTVISTKSYQDGELTTTDDIAKGRIPIREVFINVDMIVKAFESNSDVKKVIEEILENLNKESNGLFDWRMKQGETDAEIEIIDVNYTITSENANIKIEDEPFFIFNVNSPNSMVKDYNLDFKMPSGNIGNMYAIQGLGTGDTIFTTNKAVQEAMAVNALDKDLLQIIYEPDVGNYRAEQLLDEPKVDSETYNVFTSVDNLFDNNIYKISTTDSPNIIEGTELPLTDEKATTSDEDNQPKLTADEIMKTSNSTLEAGGYKIAKTFKEYYNYKINSGVQEKIPNLLPYTLNLTILGIGSIQVGDTFKIDYLPNRYQESSYLQIVKISHDIGPGGWYTSLDTQFRLLPEKTNQINNTNQKNKIRLSPSILTNLGFEDKIQAEDGWFDKNVKIADFAPYMTDIEIEYEPSWAIDYALNFKIAKELEVKNLGEGVIQNHEGNFYAQYVGPNIADTSTPLMDANLRSVQGSTNDDDFYNQYSKINSEGLGYHYDGGVSAKLLAYSYIFKIWPPDVKLRPGDKYTMLVYNDKIAILDQNNPYYNKTYKFFQQFVGPQSGPIISSGGSGTYVGGGVGDSGIDPIIEEN